TRCARRASCRFTQDRWPRRGLGLSDPSTATSAWTSLQFPGETREVHATLAPAAVAGIPTAVVRDDRRCTPGIQADTVAVLPMQGIAALVHGRLAVVAIRADKKEEPPVTRDDERRFGRAAECA